MINDTHVKHSSGGPGLYQIILQGHLSSQWSDWFDGFSITLEPNGQTVLVGPVTDQAALYGLLKKVHDLGILLISVNRLEPDGDTPGP